MTQNPTLSERELLKPITPLPAPTHGGELWKEITALFERHGLSAPPWRLRDELVNHLSWARYGDAVARRAPVAPAEPVAENVSSLIAARCVALPGPLIDCPVCGAVDKERARLEAGGAPLPHCSEDATPAQPSTVTADLREAALGAADIIEAVATDADYLASAKRLRELAVPPATSPVTGALVEAQDQNATAVGMVIAAGVVASIFGSTTIAAEILGAAGMDTRAKAEAIGCEAYDLDFLSAAFDDLANRAEVAAQKAEG